MKRRFIRSPQTSMNIAAVLVLIAPAIFFAADHWIREVPHGFILRVFWAGWWTAELTALVSIIFAVTGRGVLRFSFALMGLFEMWLIYRWFNLA